MDMANLIQDQVLPQIQDAVINADLEMEDQAEDLRDSMVGPDGALTKIGSGADDVADSMGKAAKATSELAGATNELFDALGSNDGKLQAALDKLKEYEDQLKNTQSSTVGLSNQLRQANQTIASKTAEAEHYKTALDFSTGARKVGVGTVVKLKQGTTVHYSRNNSQTDDKKHDK
jgi:ABC-type transporter Mla subunit MlaD